MTIGMKLSIGFGIACVFAYVTTPYAIYVANRFGFYDVPLGYKGHRRPTPYLGGAAVMAGFVVAVGVVAGDWRKTLPLLAGVALLWVVGTIDDRRALSPALRAAVELGLACLIWAVGLGWKLHMGSPVDLALTCLWILAVVNAFNLFDNMDGAASMMALAVSIGASLIGVLRGDVWLAVGAASLGGACVGFLPRNLALPARIFLGDGGSMPLGFAAAVLVMAAASTATVTWESLLVALLLVGVPALDTSLVVVSRRRRGVSILTGGRDHLTHRARRFLPSARAVALTLGGLQAVVSVLAVLASEGGASFVVVAAIVYLLAGAVAIVMLETQEVEEFGVRTEEPMRERRGEVRSPAVAVLTVLGLGAGLSPFFFAYYDASVWAPIGLGLVLLSAIGVVARPLRPGGPATLAVSSLLGLGVWALCSTAWAESVESAVIDGNRWLVYGALLLLLLVLLRSQMRSLALLAAAALGITAVAVSVLVRLLGSDPAALFLAGRLNSPLGYINGEGCLFVIGFWFAMALATSRRALIAGLSAGTATLMLCLALLSQSRGTALALLVSLIAVLVVAPGRVRRIYGLAVVVAGVSLAAPDLLRIYNHAAAAGIPPAAGHTAGDAALLSAVAVGVTWTLLSFGWARVCSVPALASRATAAASWLLVIPLVLTLAVAVGSAHRIEREASDQWHAFTHLAEPDASGATASAASHSRLLSGGGNRYDYWRIAVRVWRDHPLLGVGAGNYPRSYYEQRATIEDIDQPHSVELQTLSELGLPGLLLLAAFVAAVAWGVVRMRRDAARSWCSQALTVGSLGVFVAWLTQASADWMQLLPGLTAIALAASAVLVRSSDQSRRVEPAASAARDRSVLAGRRAIALGAAAVIATLIVAGASLTRQGLAEIYRSRAQGELETSPATTLTNIKRSLAIDPDSVQSYYIKSAALARFDDAPGAEAALRAALAREPDNFVTWTLLGDVASREGSSSVAAQDYMRALRLNPRDPTLIALVHPRTTTH